MWDTRIITNSPYKYLIFIEGFGAWNSLIPPIIGVFGEGFCPIMLPFVRIKEWIRLGFDSTIPTVDSLNIVGYHKVAWISVTSWQFVDLMYELWFHLGKKNNEAKYTWKFSVIQKETWAWRSRFIQPISQKTKTKTNKQYILKGLKFSKIFFFWLKLSIHFWLIFHQAIFQIKSNCIGSSYTWCNLTKITYFLGHKFLKDIMVKIGQLSINIVLLHIYDLPHSLSLPFSLIYYN